MWSCGFSGTSRGLVNLPLVLLPLPPVCWEPAGRLSPAPRPSPALPLLTWALAFLSVGSATSWCGWGQGPQQCLPFSLGGCSGGGTELIFLERVPQMVAAERE